MSSVAYLPGFHPDNTNPNQVQFLSETENDTIDCLKHNQLHGGIGLSLFLRIEITIFRLEH